MHPRRQTRYVHLFYVTDVLKRPSLIVNEKILFSKRDDIIKPNYIQEHQN
jgi:hypothetical protein